MAVFSVMAQGQGGGHCHRLENFICPELCILRPIWALRRETGAKEEVGTFLQTGVLRGSLLVITMGPHPPVPYRRADAPTKIYLKAAP